MPTWATTGGGTFAPVFLPAFEATFFTCIFLPALLGADFLVSVLAFAFAFVGVFFGPIVSNPIQTAYGSPRRAESRTIILDMCQVEVE